MSAYRKKPLVVEAVQWTGDNSDEVDVFIRRHGTPGNKFTHGDLNGRFHVAKIDGHVTIIQGGWVIAEPDGHGVYPCTEADFVATYEPCPTRRRGSPEVIKAAAEVYRENFNSRPTGAVAKAFEIAPRTASLWITKARALGYLGPTTRGKKSR